MATQETPLFKIHDATVRRKEKVILHVDDFELAEGENIALLGPNGAGKSTFIQLLTREVLPLHRDVPPVIFRGQERPSLADIKACFGVVSNTMHDQVRVHLHAISCAVACSARSAFRVMFMRPRPILKKLRSSLNVWALANLPIATL